MSAFGGMSNVVGLSSGINAGATGAAKSNKNQSGGGMGGGKIIEPLPISTAAQTAMDHQFPEPKVHFEGASLHTSWLNAHKARHGIKNEDC